MSDMAFLVVCAVIAAVGVAWALYCWKRANEAAYEAALQLVAARRERDEELFHRCRRDLSEGATPEDIRRFLRRVPAKNYWKIPPDDCEPDLQLWAAVDRAILRAEDSLADEAVDRALAEGVAPDSARWVWVTHGAPWWWAAIDRALERRVPRDGVVPDAGIREPIKMLAELAARAREDGS